MSERIDDLESTVTKLVEESNQNQIGNNNNDMNQQWNKYKNRIKNKPFHKIFLFIIKCLNLIF